jgi:hypothetical protein
MGDYKEDTSQDLRTIFFIVLFTFFVFYSSNIQGNHYPTSIKYTTHTELILGSISSHHNAIICKVFRLPDVQKCCDNTSLNISLNPFSIQNKILDYNRRIAQNFIQIQEIRLSIEPILTSKLYFHLPLNKDDNLPVLS